MGFAKIGAPGDGHVIDTQDDAAKLGSSVSCSGCGKRFAVREAADFVRRKCPECTRERPTGKE